MGAEDLAIHTGLAVIHAIEVADGGEFGEVMPALVGLGEEGEVGGGLAVWDLFFLRDGLRGEVDLAAEDGFHAGFLAGLVELDGSKKIAVIGHGDGGHAELGSALGQLLGTNHAV